MRGRKPGAAINPKAVVTGEAHGCGIAFAIISRMLPFRVLVAICTFPLFASLIAAANTSKAGTDGASVIREMNFARQHPDLYASILEARRSHYRGNLFVQPNGALLRTKEGMAGLDDAIGFLRRTRPLSPLHLSRGISMAAAEHVADQAGGGFGHGGSDRSDPASRMNRHGTWSIHWGENVSYGKSTAREIVTALIIDDGLRGRKHRANIFNSTFNYAGAALGPHMRFHTVCSIDFAGGYAERGEVTGNPLFARN
jgi:cysteine-rich secretory family protein